MSWARASAFVLCLLCGGTASGEPKPRTGDAPLPGDEFQQRRQALAQEHSDGLIVLFGLGEHEAQSAREPFRQENNFYYLTGWNEPGAALLIEPGMGGEPHSETLFLPSRDPKGERWHGPRADPQAAGRGPAAGFAAVADLAALNKAVREALTPAREVYGLLPRRHPSYGQQPEPDFTKRLKELAPGREIRDLRATVSRMRSVKSPGEVRLIQKAIDASVAAHKAAWRETREHIRERHLAGVMFSQILRHGCSRFAYAPIVGGGFNSTVLHYSKLDAELRKGDVVLIDVGGEYSHYAADITRTAPVSGSFTKRQRKIYEIVLGAQEAVIRAIRPGMRLAGEGPASLQSIAKQYLDSHGDKRLGRPLGEAMIHGVGHHVGLAVHDPVDPETPLEPGMVITVEPGVYLPEEEIGIRIEDMLLVTERGASLLTSGLPRQAEDVGRWVSRAD